jgi:hypothetical protein
LPADLPAAQTHQQPFEITQLYGPYSNSVGFYRHEAILFLLSDATFNVQRKMFSIKNLHLTKFRKVQHDNIRFLVQFSDAALGGFVPAKREIW